MLMLIAAPLVDCRAATRVAYSAVSDAATDDNGASHPTVYGLQGVLIETVEGKMVSEQAANELFNPASAIKLGTALIALQTLGPNHRYTTAFWTTEHSTELQVNLTATFT